MNLAALDNDKYIFDIEILLDDLRSICLGYHVSFSTVLPLHLSNLSDEERAQHLTQQLLFSLASVSDCSSEQINKAQLWIYEIIYFLFDRCPANDHTFRSFFKLYGMSRTLRNTLFHGRLEPSSILRTDEKPPVSVSVMELAVLRLIKASNQSDKVKAPVSELYAFRNNHISNHL